MTTQKLFFVGTSTVPYNELLPNSGPDGQIPQVYNGSWALMPFDSNGSASGSFLASACYDVFTNRIYCFGNTDGKPYSCYYSVANNNWIQIADLPNNGTVGALGGGEGFAAVIQHVAWIFGGFDEQESGANGYDTIYSYDTTQTVGTDVYNTHTLTLPNAAGDLVGCSDGSVIYVGGGANGDTGAPIVAYNMWLKFNPQQPTSFTTLANMHTAVAGAACVQIDSDTILVIGGTLNGQDELIGNTIVQAYSISANSWTLKNNFPVATCFGRACVYEGQVLCGGGWNASGFSFTSANQNGNIWVYNKTADSWSLWSPGPDMTSVLAGSGLFALPPPPNPPLWFGDVA